VTGSSRGGGPREREASVPWFGHRERRQLGRPLSAGDLGYEQRRDEERMIRQFDDTHFADFLEDAGVMPGRIGTMTAASPDGTRTVDMDGRPIGIGAFASEHIVISQ